MKLKKSNILVVGVSFLIGALLLTVGPKPGYVCSHQSMFLFKLSFIFLGVWYCIEE